MTKEEIKIFEMIDNNDLEKNIVKFFNENKEKINYKASDSSTYLTFKANEKNYNVLLEKLINHSDNFNYGLSSGTTLLQSLIAYKKWNLVELALNKELLLNDDVKVINRSNANSFDTVLTSLIKSNKENLAILAVKAGANYNYQCSEIDFRSIKDEATIRNMNELIKVINEKTIEDKIRLDNFNKNNPSLLTKVLKNIGLMRDEVTTNKNKM